MDPLLFYETFQINYYDYKQLSYKYLLENLNSAKLDDIIIDYNEIEYERAIKSSIRQTYFHAIETMFEMIFALIPNEDGTIKDRDILQNISSSKFPYDNIEKIANNNGLTFLDKLMTVKTSNISVAHHIFYLGLGGNDIESKIIESINAIKSFLILTAKDFADRREYNSYKHGLRLIPILKKFNLTDPKSGKIKLEYDLEDSLTFYSENRKNGDVEFITKTFDTNRDIKMTSVISNIIWNIVRIRRVLYFPKTGSDSVNIIFFDKDNIEQANRQNVKLKDFKLKFSM